jgi:hypothetical protein
VLRQGEGDGSRYHRSENRKDGDSSHRTPLIGGAVTYPSDSDRKNIRYVFWKNGLYGMNLDTATGTMIAMTGDTLDINYVIKDC